ncbi:hypothetical protein BJY01DRAFT_99529 [Aspergillus pseudoustus]|uniref:Zn(2)-C6 fungal-type domain-containing protein n=1 Tax=Aspergillus pseudoustus TaxID=1810923 RepID=A0ABR4IY86_9EURO
MPAQRRLRRSPLECARCTQSQMECSKIRPQCDECKSQRLSCRYVDQLPSKQAQRAHKPSVRMSKASFTSDSSSRYSSPSPPTEHPPPSVTSPPSSQSAESTTSDGQLDERAKSPASIVSASDMSSQDQELLHHWQSITEQSLTPAKSKDRSWQSVIRREAPNYPALHHSALALSAMQLASKSKTGSSDRKDHLKAAGHHYNLAVEKTPKLGNATSQSECNSAFSASSILFMCELASSSLDGEDWKAPRGRERDSSPSPQSPALSLQKLLELFKTVRKLIPNTQTLDTAEKGELKDLFTRADPYHQLPSTYTLTILSMRNLNATTAKADPSHETKIYDETIKYLDNSLAMLSKGGDPTMVALRWMFRIPSRYIELVEEKKPLALIIFAHYCAVLHHLRDRWWMDGLGARLVKEISQLLEPARMNSILWASDIVGVQT